jgi:hypothetical protein
MNEILRDAASQAAAELVSQPELFGGPVEDPRVAGAALLPAVRRPHTGAVVTRDEGKVLTVAALRTLGLSDRRIAAMAGVARESIGPIMQEAERRGLVRPLKERLASAVGMLAEESTAAARELVQDLRDGDRSEGVTMALRALGPIVGIAAEKMQLLTGGATEIVETRAGRSETDEAEFLARLRSGSVPVEAVEVRPADSESDAQPRNPLVPNGPVAGDTAGDTGPAAQAVSGCPSGCPVEGAGGGSRAGGGVTNDDGSRGSAISAHGANP